MAQTATRAAATMHMLHVGSLMHCSEDCKGLQAAKVDSSLLLVHANSGHQDLQPPA